MPQLKMPTDPADKNATDVYLNKKEDRSLAETALFLKLRLDADKPAPDAKLMIVYEEAGTFRRVFCRSLTGSQIRAMIAGLDLLAAETV